MGLTGIVCGREREIDRILTVNTFGAVGDGSGWSL